MKKFRNMQHIKQQATIKESIKQWRLSAREFNDIDILGVPQETEGSQMKPIRTIEEFEAILKRAEKEHQKHRLENVSLEILEEALRVKTKWQECGKQCFFKYNPEMLVCKKCNRRNPR